MQTAEELNVFFNMDISLLKQIFGKDLHYHFATGIYDPENPFAQAVIDLLPYFKYESNVLDCGSGWGGPARILQEKLNCNVTGVTVSSEQAKYSAEFFTTITADLHDYHPAEHYDTALFLESYCHLNNPVQVLTNLKDSVDALVIKDFVYPTFFDETQWHVKVHTQDMFITDLETAGFEIKEFKIEYNFIKNSAIYWLNNLNKLNLDINTLPKQLQLLHQFSIDFLSPNKFGDLGSCTIYATKK